MEQATVDSVSDDATAVAASEILAAIDSADGIEQRNAQSPAGTAPETVGHGPIRLRIRRIVQETEGEIGEPVTVREIVGHGTIRLRDRSDAGSGVSVDVDIHDRPLPGEAIGHGPIGLRQPDDEPEFPDMTDAARADIRKAIASLS